MAKKQRKHESDSDEDEQDVRLYLESYKRAKLNEKQQSTQVQALFTPRSNHSMVTLVDGIILLFGGEWTDGRRKTIFYDDLFALDPNSGSFSAIDTGIQSKPAPRCGHSAVALTGDNWCGMFLFGGEFGTPSEKQFLHFNDAWLLVKMKGSSAADSFKWIRLEPVAESPCARSGHRMCVLEDGGVVLFGGYIGTSGKGTTAYLNDLWVGQVDFRAASIRWSACKFPAKASIPTARSAGHLHALGASEVLLYGGYSIEGKKMSGVCHSDCWTINLASMQWFEKKLSGKEHPMPRSGATSWQSSDRTCLYLYGGVVDAETSDDILCGSCLGDLWCLRLKKMSWLRISSDATAIFFPGRYNASVAPLGSSVLICGGIHEVGDAMVVLDDVHRVEIALPSNELSVTCIKPLSVPIPQPQTTVSSDESQLGSSSDYSSDQSTSQSD